MKEREGRSVGCKWQEEKEEQQRKVKVWKLSERVTLKKTWAEESDAVKHWSGSLAHILEPPPPPAANPAAICQFHNPHFSSQNMEICSVTVVEKNSTEF